MEWDLLTTSVLAGSVFGPISAFRIEPDAGARPWSSQPLALRAFVVLALLGAVALAVYLVADGRELLAGIFVASSVISGAIGRWRYATSSRGA